MKAIIILILLAVFFLWIWKMMEPEKSIWDILKEVLHTFKTPNMSSEPAGSPVQNQYWLYQTYGTDYENFASIVWDCIKSLHRKFHLACPANTSDIYAAEIADRIKLNNGRLTFHYEISLSEVLYEGGMKRVTPPLDTQDLADALSRNLPAYMRGGYSFTGNITVWDIGNNTYRIEIEGVVRQYNPYICTGDIII